MLSFLAGMLTPRAHPLYSLLQFFPAPFNATRSRGGTCVHFHHNILLHILVEAIRVSPVCLPPRPQGEWKPMQLLSARPNFVFFLNHFEPSSKRFTTYFGWGRKELISPGTASVIPQWDTLKQTSPDFGCRQKRHMRHSPNLTQWFAPWPILLQSFSPLDKKYVSERF